MTDLSWYVENGIIELSEIEGLTEDELLLLKERLESRDEIAFEEYKEDFHEKS